MKETRSTTSLRRSPAGWRRAVRNGSLIRTLEKMVKRLERDNEDKYAWKKDGNKFQDAFNLSIQDWITEDLCVKLEYYSLEDTIKKGEEYLSERKHLLKIADSYGWNSAKEILSVELARKEKKEKKLQRIRKEFRCL